jgi:hypothetical protein
LLSSCDLCFFGLYGYDDVIVTSNVNNPIAKTGGSRRFGLDDFRGESFLLKGWTDCVEILLGNFISVNS